MIFRSQDLKRLVDTHGKSLTYTVKGNPTYDPSTATVTSSDTTYTVKAFFYNYGLNEIDGTSVQVGDRRVVMNLVDTSGSAVPEPEPGDKISGEGDEVYVVGVMKIMSGINPVCYTCQVRE